jgi:glutathione S-transferase
MSSPSKKVSERVGVHKRTSGIALPWSQVALGFASAVALSLFAVSGFNGALIGAILSFASVNLLSSWQSNPIRVRDYEKNNVYLFVPASVTDLKSHFDSLHIRYLLVLKQIKHTVIKTDVPCPRGNFPFIELNGETISHPDFILQHLDLPEEQTFTEREVINKDLFELALRDSLSFMDYYIWFDRHCSSDASSIHFPYLPKPLARTVGYICKMFALVRLNGTDFFKLTRKEVDYLAHARIGLIAQFLGKRTYASGPTLGALDAALTAFADMMLNFPINTPLRQMVLQHQNLQNYRKTMEKHISVDMDSQEEH